MLDLLFFHDLGNIPLILPPAYEIFGLEMDICVKCREILIFVDFGVFLKSLEG